MNFPIRRKILLTVLIPAFLIVLAMSFAYYMLAVSNLKKTSSEHINIAYKVIFDSLSSKANESVPWLDKFLKDEIAGNINIIYATKERFEIDPQKKKEPQRKRHVRELISRFGRMAAAIEDFSALTPFNNITIYDKNGVVVTAFQNIKGHYRLGAYLDFVKGGIFVSLKTQEDKFNLLRGIENIEPISLPKCVKKEFKQPVPEKTTAFFSTFEGMPAIKLVAPIKHYDKLLGVCVAYIIIDKNKVNCFSKYSRTEINFFAGTNLSVGTLPSEKNLSWTEDEEAYVIDFLNFDEIPSGAINHVAIGKDKDYYRRKLLISDGKTPIGGITVSYSCQYENEQLKKLLMIVLAMGAVFGLLVFILSIVLARKIVKPIERLERSVKNYEKDGFTILPVNSNDEVGNLTMSFNFMVKQIEENIRKITSETIERKHAEYALLKSEEKYKNLISEIPDVVWSSNQAGETNYISPNVEKIYGYSPKEIYEAKGKLFLGRIHPDDVENVKKLYTLLFTEKKIFDVEYRIKSKDGKWIWLHDRAAYVYEEKGIQFATGIFSDITEKKSAEKALKDSEEKERIFREKLTLLHEVSTLLSNCSAENELWKSAVELGKNKLGFDRLGIWLLTNKPGELHGTFGTSLDGKVQDETHLKGRNDPDSSIDKALKLMTSCLYIENDEIMDDDNKQVIGHAERVIAPLWDGNKAIGIISMDNFIRHKPITDNDRNLLILYASFLGHLGTRLRAIEKLQNSEQRNRALLQSVPDTICLFDKNGVCLEYKAEKHMPMLEKPDWYVGKHMMELLPENIAKMGTELLKKALRTGETQMAEYELTFLNEKHPRYFDARISPLSSMDQALILIRDITEKKRSEKKRLNLERQVLHAQKLESLGILAGGIAHDFNNILMGVLGYADLTLKELPPQSPVRNNLMEINKAACRAADLAKQMLAYSGKGKFIIEFIYLNDFIDEMSHILEVSITKKAALKYNYSDNLPTFKGDPTQIRQIIMNLITNASESLEGKSGIISISTGAMFCDQDYLNHDNFAFLGDVDVPLREGTYVYIEVSDTGCGMTDDITEKIFDPFFTTKFTGRGLGMAALLGIIRGHKGAIKIKSVLGKGTTFRILFPAEKGPVKLQKKDSGSRDNEKIREVKGAFLIADDEETVCAVGKMIVESLGFDVLIAENGKKAVEVFRENADDIVCVLLDLSMPYLNGEEVFCEIRKINPDIKVILSSGYNEQDVTQKFTGKGLAGFIQKPFGSQALIEKIKQIFDF